MLLEVSLFVFRFEFDRLLEALLENVIQTGLLEEPHLYGFFNLELFRVEVKLTICSHNRLVPVQNLSFTLLLYRPLTADHGRNLSV